MFLIGLIIGLAVGFGWAFFIFKPVYWFDKGYEACSSKVSEWITKTRTELERELKDDSTD